MYYWKIWRETRARFFALLILGLCVGWSAWSEVSLILARAGFEIGQMIPPTIAAEAWARGMGRVMAVGGVTLYFMGLVAGSSGLGEEIERGTAVFLLTRPRSRGYFVWSFWLASGFELLAFTLIAMLAGYATLFYMIRRTGPWNFLLIGPILLITGLLAVGLAHLLTTGSRRSKNAVAGGVAFTVTYLVALYVSIYCSRHYHTPSLPSPLEMYSLSFNAALAGTMLGWLGAAVALIALAHLIVTRMEV
jgi:ABC-type transport system involved in multi-copper enzyme maturation permease subunit